MSTTCEGADDIDQRAEATLALLRLRPTDEALEQARKLLKDVRDARQFLWLVKLAEAAARLRPGDSVVAGFYAQGLIETGACLPAIALLDRALRAPGIGASDAGELHGLRGRAYKQIFMDCADHSQAEAAQAIEQAVDSYRVPFENNPANYWHGINLAACLYAARRRKLDPAPDLSPQEVARNVLKVLDTTHAADCGAWWWATKGEAHVALGEWDDAETAIGVYVRDESIPPFNYASTMRQFREVWEIHKDGARGETLMQLLDAALAAREGGVLSVTPDHVRAMRSAGTPSKEQAEKVLGTTNAQTLTWYRCGLDRATSVAAIRHLHGGRFGTGFAVRAGDFGLEPASETLVLTNYHVVNRAGAEDAERPENVEITFEAAEGPARGPYMVSEVLAESPYARLDYSLLKLAGDTSQVPTVPIIDILPRLEPPARVYIIGHPSGDELHIAFQDNRLLDHEGPPAGCPPTPDQCRVHYHAPTSPGNSGSPVFDDTWRVIALHHAGGKYDPQSSQMGMRRLNGKPGRYSANEGLWIASVVEDVKRQAIPSRS
ncbi:trypsin-like peptidase domain-containing protein [Paracoccus niistensis]|uniref:Trypsin-like peptidase domain-containing protein n=1 Tax=Paracoccus niistensis TaxID=632935 RepID=A0ABV6I049_9RHOB